jgi:hypothetical protein
MTCTNPRLLLPLLAALLLLPGTALARHNRSLFAGSVQGLLLDLARLEILNVEREEPQVERAIQGQIVTMRRQLLGVIDGSVPLPVALQSAQRSLRAIAAYNEHSYYDDEQVSPRLAAQIQQLRARVDQMLAQGTPPPYGQPPPYGWPPYGQQPPPPPPPYPPPAPPYGQQPPPGYGRPLPMAPDRFDRLVAQVQQAMYQDAQLRMVKDAARSGNWFTCQQIVRLMHVSPYGSAQVQIAAALYPQAVDPQNFTDLLAALIYESDRQRLRQLVGR